MGKKSSHDGNHQEPVAHSEKHERARDIVEAYNGDKAMESSRLAFRTVLEQCGMVVPPDSGEGRSRLAGLFIYLWMHCFPVRARDAWKVPLEIWKYLQAVKSDIPKDQLYPHDLVNELRKLGLTPHEYMPLVEEKWYEMDKNQREACKVKLKDANKKHNSRYNIALKPKKKKKKLRGT